MAEVAADVRQARAGPQQTCGQGVPGLVGDPAADVKIVDPELEAPVEPVVGQRLLSVSVALVGGEQRQLGSLVWRGRPVVARDEQGLGLALASFQKLVEPLGDAKGLVVVADLGLVVPEHGESAVAAEAVQPEFEHFAAATAGDNDRLPGVPQAAVARVVDLGQCAQVGLVCERAGDGVGEG